jgi:hypothetical protein
VHATRPSGRAFFSCHSPAIGPARRARSRRGRPMAVDECFQADENVTLAVLALAWLAVTHAAFADFGQPSATRSAGLISTANTIPTR